MDFFWRFRNKLDSLGVRAMIQEHRQDKFPLECFLSSIVHLNILNAFLLINLPLILWCLEKFIHFIIKELCQEPIMGFLRFVPLSNEFFQLMLYAHLKTFLIFLKLHHSLLSIFTHIICQFIAKWFTNLDFED